jgi:hypothetical protein
MSTKIAGDWVLFAGSDEHYTARPLDRGCGWRPRR